MQGDLVVFSHLRWTGVWQRPQHLVSRIGRHRSVWFVEEPVPIDGPGGGLCTEVQPDGVTRVWLEVPDVGRHVGFEPDVLERYRTLLPPLLGRPAERVVWLYSPLPLEVAQSLQPNVLVFDVMDDLASFKGAAPELVVRHRQALRVADVVFAGGRTLHRDVCRHRPDARLFPSGVEPEHYATARVLRGPHATPVAGYVGVIDERLDLELLDGLAAALPDWELQVVGPVAKIDPAELPSRPNLRYLGSQPYAQLPQIMAGFDVALMPFALNDATRTISPTKTLEYLAAGLPVVSTPIADVVEAFGTVVDVRTDAEGFASACRQVIGHDLSERDRALRPLLEEHRWDRIAADMDLLVTERLDERTIEVSA